MSKKSKTSSITFKDVYEVHLKYIEYLLSRTQLYHTSFKNISESGNDVEIEIRNFLKHFLPGRFRITHGYIVDVKDQNSEPVISPQIDLIIVDELVQNRIFSLGKSDGIDIVPVEAVVGIFEIKRTLNETSLRQALDHIELIKQSVNIVKSNKGYYFPGGDLADGFRTGYHSNPFLGVISLTSEFKKSPTAFVDEFAADLVSNEIDMLMSLDGFLGCLVEKETGNIMMQTFRSNSYDYHFGALTKLQFNQISLISRSIGVLLAYLSYTVGRRIKFENYFFNKKTWELISEQAGPGN